MKLHLSVMQKVHNWLARAVGRSYQTELVSVDNKMIHVSFHQGSAWNALVNASNLADEKTEKENIKFAVRKIERV